MISSIEYNFGNADGQANVHVIEHPAITRKALGIEDGFVRLSVGIEDIEDLKADLSYALA